MKNISKLISEIRDIINTARDSFGLLKDPTNWNKITSSLDVIEDTEIAIAAYLDNSKKSISKGENYLIIYGIFQVLFVNQNAVIDLADAIKLKLPRNNKLIWIREIRNNCIGHPTRKRVGKGDAFNFISRMSMSYENFQLMTLYQDREPQLLHINIPELIFEQNKVHYKMFQNFLKKLKRDEMEHKSKYKDSKLVDIFPTTLSYYFSKMYETIMGGMPDNFGEHFIGQIREVINNFKEALRNRGLLDNSNLTYHFEELNYPLEKLEEYFMKSEHSSLIDKDANVFCFYIEKHVEKLQDIAEEIDIEYDD